MHTLHRWVSRLTSTPNVIDCREMTLLSVEDGEPPIFTGPGEIEIRTSTDIRYKMYATAADGSSAFRRLIEVHNNPYNVHSQFRLQAKDYDGNEWLCGWTRPSLGDGRVGWLLTGSVSSLTTDVSGAWVAKTRGVELMFQPKLELPVLQTMVSVTSIGDKEVEYIRKLGRHTLSVLGADIEFLYAPSEDLLWVSASTSDQLDHPYIENWLSEPLRILLGQLAYPRLVARNFGDGKAQVWLRPSPALHYNSGIASLIGGDVLDPSSDFWDLYAGLLTLIATARDKCSKPNFGAHPLTQFYEELIQATQGSRWVMCLTLASVLEGLVKLLMGNGEQRSDFSDEDIDDLKKVVLEWSGDCKLRSRIVSDIERARLRTIGRYLVDLVDRGILEERNRRAWSGVRHAVMHGNLVSPWGSQEEDQRLMDLANGVHRLTRAVIGRAAEPGRQT